MTAVAMPVATAGQNATLNEPISATPVPVRLVADRILSEPAEQRLHWLCEQIARNRFLPVPASEQMFVGDGDFRAIGAEFLRYFVLQGGLRPHEAVLDIGCGIGRMALPLTQYLSDAGSYHGMDIVSSGIDWCRERISRHYPNFQFLHLDLQHPIYNPEGECLAERLPLPFADESFDFVLLTSVLTHLPAPETELYAREIGRLLRPRGRCFLSLFLIDDEARELLRRGCDRLPFDVSAAGPEYQADPDHPGGAVAYDEDFLLRLFADQGLGLALPIRHGHWSGRAADNYQDICVLAKADRGTE